MIVRQQRLECAAQRGGVELRRRRMRAGFDHGVHRVRPRAASDGRRLAAFPTGGPSGPSRRASRRATAVRRIELIVGVAAGAEVGGEQKPDVASAEPDREGTSPSRSRRRGRSPRAGRAAAAAAAATAGARRDRPPPARPVRAAPHRRLRERATAPTGHAAGPPTGRRTVPRARSPTQPDRPALLRLEGWGRAVLRGGADPPGACAWKGQEVCRRGHSYN